MQDTEPPIGAALERLLARRVGPDSPPEATLAAYEELFGGVWSQLARLMGHRGTAAIFKRAAYLAGRSHPLVGRVGVSATGLDFDALREAISSGGHGVVGQAGTALLQAVAEVVADLIGPKLLLTVLSDVELALQRKATARAAESEQGPATPHKESSNQGES